MLRVKQTGTFKLCALILRRFSFLATTQKCITSSVSPVPPSLCLSQNLQKTLEPLPCLSLITFTHTGIYKARVVFAFANEESHCFPYSSCCFCYRHLPLSQTSSVPEMWTSFPSSLNILIILQNCIVHTDVRGNQSFLLLHIFSFSSFTTPLRYDVLPVCFNEAVNG